MSGRAGTDLRIGIVVVAYNAAGTLAGVLDRIPRPLRDRIAAVLVCDDASDDATYLVGVGYREVEPDLPLTVVRHPRNLGYGGNQKAGYRLAIEQGLDVVVLLHGDGQYAPESMPDLLAPFEDGADAVFGSRMMVPGSARRGGMPRYKYVGNRILSTVQNRLAGLELSEWHSGYRAYRVSALASIDFESNSDGFDFDTEIILQLHAAGARIVEVPIPTYYGDEICHVNGLQYARDVVADALRYRLGAAGLGSGRLASPGEAYDYKGSDDSSHGQILALLSAVRPGRVLDLGCSGGLLAEQLRKLGHTVVGVDVVEVPGVRDRVDEFHQADLDDGLPAGVSGAFDVVLAADVLEHGRRPDRLLRELRSRLAPGGVVVASVPNFGHWYPRLRTFFGAFDYDRRGILDEGHLRFFTRRSFARLAARSGMRIRRTTCTGLPLESLPVPGRLATLVRWLDRGSVAVRPTLFAYQFVCVLEPADPPAAASVLVSRAEGRQSRPA